MSTHIFKSVHGRGWKSEPSGSTECLSVMCTQFLMRSVSGGFVALVMLAGCGVISPPPAAPPPAVEPNATVAAQAPKRPTAEIPKAAAKPDAPKPASPKPATPQTAKAPALDLRSLEQRLKDTNAIGVMTKLSLKNQVDDLVAQFRAFHDGHRPPTLTELRRPFELLLMKVLSLLQDQDPALANQINASREAIWGLLSDRDKLAPYL